MPSSEPTFKDHFSGHAGEYARHRPRYPEALFAFLAGVAPRHERAWDCATGNGQCALGLAPHFAQVVATDASEEQIRAAFPHERVTYRVAPAEAPGLDAASVDLVTVAQALHWFDIPRFFAEAARVLRPGGVVAVWCYPLMLVSPEVDPIVERLYDGTTAPYWPPERRMVDDEYRSLDFPFEPVATPVFEMEQDWSFTEMLGYLGTWSATKRYIQANGADPIAAAADELAAAWGDPAERKRIRWPVRPRVGRTPSAG